MKQLLDFLPIVLFAITYFKFGGLYPATAVLMGATVVQMLALYVIEKKLPAMHKATLALILLFGTLTLVYRDPRFLQWKFTILHGGFGLVLAVALFGFKRNLIKTMLQVQIQLPESAWQVLCISWILFFWLMALVNTGMIFYFDMAAWTIFKVASIGAFFIFAIAQAFYIAKYLPKDSD